MQENVFDFKSYKAFLNKALPTSGQSRGARSQLAHHLSCQTAFISQVLNQDTHFSLEHGYMTAQFLKLTGEETKFFLLLIQRDRSGRKDLSQFFSEQINEILEKRKIVQERIQVKEALSIEHQATYYSAWYYAAVHILLSIPEFQTTQGLSQRLGISLKLTEEILNFLCSVGLAVREGVKFKIGSTRIHISPNSPMISKHHSNWRIKAIQSLDNREPQSLHYSIIMSLSRNDIEAIRNILLESVEKSEKVFLKSPEEVLHCLSIDFFEIL